MTVESESAAGADYIRQGFDALIAAGSTPLEALIATFDSLLLAKADGATGVPVIGASAVTVEEVEDATGAASRFQTLDSNGDYYEATYTESLGFLQTVERRTAISTAAPDLVIAHAGKILHLSHAAPTLTVQPQATEAYPSVMEVEIVSDNAATITADTGVSINGSSASSWTLAAIPGAASLKKTASDTWILIGAVEAV